MTLRLALLALLPACLLAADQAPNTQRIEFPAGGLLRLENSAGEVQIEGWDRPDVEITTMTLSPEVKVAAVRHDQEVTITTRFPRGRWHPLPPGARVQADLTYIIKVPHDARLAIDHGEGEVHVAQVTGDVHATVSRGSITMSLDPGAHYEVDARSRLGSVVSDFQGQQRTRLWFFNHRLAEHPSGSARKLYLRVGFGDIVLLKTW